MPKNTKSFLICAHRINVSSKGKNGKNWKWSSLKSSQQPVKKKNNEKILSRCLLCARHGARFFQISESYAGAWGVQMHDRRWVRARAIQDCSESWGKCPKGPRHQQKGARVFLSKGKVTGIASPLSLGGQLKPGANVHYRFYTTNSQTATH